MGARPGSSKLRDDGKEVNREEDSRITSAIEERKKERENGQPLFKIKLILYIYRSGPQREVHGKSGVYLFMI